MDIKVTSQEELVAIQSEIFFNKTSKATKISDDSVLRGLFGGTAKTGQKALKDIALLKGYVYADSASGPQLDELANDRGVAPRFGASASSTWLRIAAAAGTEYVQGIHTFTGPAGIVFDLTENVTIDAFGYAFVRVRSREQGLRANVDALSLTKVTPTPASHQYVINDFRATGGRDVEQDDVFRLRIKEGANIAARGTLAMLEQVFMKINPNVLRVTRLGHNSLGQIALGVVTQNGVDLTEQELGTLLEKAEDFLSITEIRAYSHRHIGVKLLNIPYLPVDMDFRVQLDNSANPDEVRREIQLRLSRKLDFRFFEDGDKVEWDDLLQVVKMTRGVKYVPDNFFIPNKDRTVPRGMLPRVRGFIMRDMAGGIIRDLSGALNPVHFEAKPDRSYQETILGDI